MAERTIVLNDEDAAALDRLVAHGGFADAAEALHESLALAELARDSAALREAAFRAAVQVGLDDVAAGRVIELATPAELNAYLDRLLAESPDDPDT